MNLARSTLSIRPLDEAPSLKREAVVVRAVRFQKFPPLFTASIIALIVCRLLLMYRFPLIGDEAYYWLWSKHLSLGYHDHPPLIGWLIALSTQFSNHPFWVRFPSLVLAVASVFLLYFFAKDILINKPKAERAFLFFLFSPILAISTIAIFPDAPLIFSWILCLWGSWKSLKDDRYWIIVGIAIGLSLLSKLTGIFLLGSLMLFLIINREVRNSLKKPWFWCGVFSALLTSLPLWVWNFQHGFENFVFQAHDHLTTHPPTPLLSLLGYLGAQTLCVSIGTFALLILATLHLLKKGLQGETAAQFLLCFALPVHVLFLALTLFARVGVHWAIPGYIPLFVACADMDYFKKAQNLAIKIGIVTTFFFYAVLLFPTAAAKGGVLLDHSFPRLNIASALTGKGFGEILGYTQLAQIVANKLDSVGNGKGFLLTDSYTLTSDFIFYAKKNAGTLLLSGQGAEYARWDSFSTFARQNAIWVDFEPLADNQDAQKILTKAFKKVGITESVKVTDGPVTRVFYLNTLYDLQHPELLHPRIQDAPFSRE